MSLFELIRQFGFEVGIIIFFIVQTNIREKRLIQRLDKIQDVQFEELRRLTMESLNTVKDNTFIMDQLKEMINEYKYSERDHRTIITDLKTLIKDNQENIDGSS